MSEVDSFPIEIIQELKTYVYRLIDPRNGETFYVGKAQANRVFAHARGEPQDGDELNDKLKRINAIKKAGFEVAHVIHRHGMNEDTAFEVEAALIDAYPGLTNIAGGAGSNFGAMHAREIVNRYKAEEAEFQHRALLIIINRTAGVTSTYEATRYAWRLSKSKAEKAEVILAVEHGMIVDAFVADEWYPATTEHFPDREPSDGRYGFVGHVASPEVKALYFNKKIPDEYRKPGASNPIKYTW